MKRSFLAIAILTSILFLVPSAQAQMMDQEIKSGTEGFFVNLSLNGTSLSIEGFDEDEQDTGGGGSLTLGYGISPRFAIFLSGSSASMNAEDSDAYLLAHGDLGVRYHFANPDRAAIPFLELALTGRTATIEDVDLGGGSAEDVEMSGAGISVGGGLLYFLNPKWALTGSLDWSTGEFNTIKVGSVSVDGLDVDARSVRVDLGVTWYPGR